MSDVDFTAVMADVTKANDQGLDFRGKKYTVVSARVEIFRKHFGAHLGIETDIVAFGKLKGEPIVMSATIKDASGFIVGKGHAWEVIGEGNVNRTSALENAETSAIGRALASLGIHGGEYASANELRDKAPNPTKEALQDAEEQAILDSLPMDEPSEMAIAHAYAARIEEKATGYKTRSGLDGYMKSELVQTWMDRISRADDDLRKGVREKVLAYREGLTK